MTEGESISAVLLAGALGGFVGAALMFWFSAARRRWMVERETHREVVTDWLAARITLGHASVSFVTAFRSLGAVRQASCFFSLRQAEAQRARAEWVRATRTLTIAEARLRVCRPNGDLAGRAARLGRISVKSLRAGIEGDEAEVDRLIHSVLVMEQQAIVFAEEAAAGLSPLRRASFLREMLRNAAASMEAVADGWARNDS